MICNGINFNNQWLAGFTSAESFADHEKCKRYIALGMASRDALISFFEVFQSTQTVKDVRINHTGIQGTVQENKPEAGNSGNDQGKVGDHSRLTGNTVPPGRKSGRNKVSKL